MTWETALIIAGLCAVVSLAVWSVIQDRKKGRSCSCGCSCQSCPMSGKCHAAQDKETES